MKGYLVWLIVAFALVACGSMAELLPSNRDKMNTQELGTMKAQLNGIYKAIRAKKSLMLLRQNQIETVSKKMSSLYREIEKIQDQLLSENLEIGKVTAQLLQEQCSSSEKVNEYVQQMAKERAEKMKAGELEPNIKKTLREKLIILREQSVLNLVPEDLD